MEIICRFEGNVAMLGLSGRLTVSAAETEILPFRTAIGTLIAQGHVVVALDLSRVTHIDARGLAELVQAYTTLRRLGGQLTLIALSPRVRQLLAVTRLDTVFAVRERAPDPVGSQTCAESLVDATWGPSHLAARA